MDQHTTVVVGDKVYLPVLDTTLTDAHKKKAEEELNETPAVRERALCDLKTMLADQKEMNPRTDDVFLLQFLRVKKFDTQTAFRSIMGYYTFRAKTPWLYTLPTKVEKALKSEYIAVLPHRDDQGRVVFIMKLGAWNPADVPYYDFVSAVVILVECFTSNPVTQVNGIATIWESKGVSISHFFQFSIKRIKMLMEMILKRIPARMKVSYAVNPFYLTYAAYYLCKPFINEKMRKRLKIVDSMSELHKYIDPQILPEEYGGKMPIYDYRQLKRYMLSKEDDFKYDRNFGYMNEDSGT